jgi:glycine betaine/proline transport system substrate-binding protein
MTMSAVRYLLLASALFFLTQSHLGATSQNSCQSDETIGIGALQYESGAFNAALISELIERGFNCKTVFRRGETLTLIDQLAHGKIDLLPEVWIEEAPAIWKDAIGNGKVVVLSEGAVASEGWFVPLFVAQQRQLFKVEDLKTTPNLFLYNKEEKGRFYNCPLGSVCQIANTKKLDAYGLSREYIDFVVESYEVIEQQALAAVQKRQAIVFYYWEPSSLISTGQFVKLREPQFDRDVWQRFLSEKSPDRACASPETRIAIAASDRFVSLHLEITAMLRRITVNSSQLASILQAMRAYKLTPRSAAINFLVEHPDIWHLWADESIVKKIDSSLQN